MTFTKIFEARNWASSFLQEHDREQGVVDILLCHHLKVTKHELYASLRETFKDDLQQKFIEDIKKHAENGIPVQHLTGEEEFYGRRFEVNKHVLIPRPETEELVHGVLQRIPTGEALSVVDVGTGTGIIAITLKKEAEHLQVSAVDLSEDALETALKNAQKLQADVAFYHGSFLMPLIEQGKKVNVIVSNPPYIPYEDRDTLSDTVRNYDPELALFAERDGLAAYEQIIEQIPKVIEGKALVAFEIGYQQGEAVKALLQAKFPQSQPEVKQDINGKDRMVFAWVENY